MQGSICEASRLGLFLFVTWASVQAAAGQVGSGQTIRGQVVDGDAQTPLPGATVVVLETSPLLGTTTDPDGWFVLERVPLGRRDVGASFLGYEPLVVPEVLVASGKEVVLRIALEERVLEGEEVVVVPEGRGNRPLNDFAAVSSRSFSVEETRRYAGGLDDPARMASAFAGVATGGAIQDNALTIRGNAPKGVLWRLEGVEIPTPSHFANLSVAGGGGVTLFSGQLLADSDFFTSAFPAEYGNALAGVFDMSFRTGNPASREHALQAGLLGIEAASEGPFTRGKSSTYLFNYRYSTLGLLLPLLPTDDVATYQDLSFKLSFPTRRWGRLEAWGIGGRDGQQMAATADSAEWEFETWDRLESDLTLTIAAGGLSHDLIVGPRTFIHSAAAATMSRTALDEERMGDDLVLRDNLRIRDASGRIIIGAHLNHKFSRRHTNRTGFSGHRLFYGLEFAAASGRYETPEPVAQGAGGSTLLQFFSQSVIDLSSRWSINAGLHVQHFALTASTSAEPRIGARWQITDGQAFSAGYGLHSQVEDLRIYLTRTAGDRAMANRALDPARAHHAVLGYERQLGASTRLKLETYYQHLFDVPVVPDSSYSLINFEQDLTFDEQLVNRGLGRNYGLELTLERALRDGYYYLLTGAIFRSRYRGGDGVWRDSRFDRIHASNALFGKEFTVGGDDLLGVNARFILMGGKRQSPVDMPASRAAEEVVYDGSRAFRKREPRLLVFDLTLTYRRNHVRHSDVWALQVKNLLAAKDVSMDYNFSTDRVEEVREGFPLPVLSYKVEF